MPNLKLTVDDDGFALVLFDVPGQSMNTLTKAAIEEIGDLVTRLRTDDSLKGAILASGKASGFCAGADLDEMLDRLNAAQGGASEEVLREELTYFSSLTAILRALETCGKPVAVALEGLALGGGLELALACHYRVVADSPRVKLGLPEATIGLLPGAGGTQRLPRLVGAMAALPMLLEGKPVTPQEALKLGFVNAVVAPGETIENARNWLREVGDPVQPWDKKGYKLPGGAIYSPANAMALAGANAMLRDKSFGNFPALRFIMSCVYEGCQVPMEAGLRIESRYFVNVMRTPQAKAMVRSLFVSMQELGKGSSRPKDHARTDISKVAVIGAGMMGAGIAYVQAAVGIDTVLIDQDLVSAEKGKDYSRRLVSKQVARGKLPQDKADALLARIVTTDGYDAVEGSDLVVEAVFENREIKRDVTQKAEARLAEDAVFGSNTSTLPITGLAEASKQPANFIGLHFFSPVDRMGLVEIIRGRETSDATVAKAIDYVLKIRKTPIVVSDGRGFYTSRVFGKYLEEGFEMLAEGIAPAIIDNVGRMTSMPRGPLELTDDVALDLWVKVKAQTKADVGNAYEANPGDAIVRDLVDRGRLGRKTGQGFYDYPVDGSKRLWSGLAEVAEVRISEVDAEDVQTLRDRFLYRQAVEAARCFDEGILTDPRDADVGAILGWGFAPWTGGPLSYIDGIGTAAFVARADELAQRYGSRFAPPPGLREMASRGESYYGRALATAEAA